MNPDLYAEARLDRAITFGQPLSPHALDPQVIFLTGASGFLGAFLLESLLNRTSATVYCLMRGGDPRVGREQLRQHLQFYKLDSVLKAPSPDSSGNGANPAPPQGADPAWDQVWESAFDRRVIPVMGDLRQPYLGLDIDTWDTLARTVDTIYHSAALVNSAVSYATLRPINVQGTEEILRLASLYHTKPVHFISTMAVLLNPQLPPDVPLLETDIPPLEGLSGGYKQSKWVAEALVREAQSRGLPACIHRPARIMGDSRTGIIGNLADFICSLIKGCVRFGSVPLAEAQINLMPVDYVAAAIVHLSQPRGDHHPWGKTFNLMNPQFTPWGDLCHCLQATGYTLAEVPLAEWMGELQRRVSYYPQEELYGSLLLLLTSPLNVFAPKPIISLAQSTAALAGSGIECPPVDLPLVQRYVSYFQDSGYLPTPAQQQMDLQNYSLQQHSPQEEKPQERSPASPATPSPAPAGDRPKAPTAFWKGIRSNVRSQQGAFAIDPVPRDRPLPLSFGQERLWYIEQLGQAWGGEGNPVHNLRAVFRLRGPLDLPTLERCFQEIIRRQEVLRSAFPALEGQPSLQILPEVPFHIALENLEHLSPADQEAAIATAAATAAQEPFDLTQAPLMRVKVLRLGPTDHAMLRTVHHIINDVWSDTVRLRELASLYTAFSQGKPSPLADLKVQYADFAHAQRQWLQGETLRREVAYWQKQLAAPIPLLRLPQDPPPDDRSGATLPTYGGAAVVITLGEELTQALKALTQEAGVSLFTTLLAGYKVLLHRYSGQKDLVLCSPVASRKQPATKALLGYFSNIVLIRTRLGGNPSFRQVIDRVSQSTLGAFDHNELPFQQLVEDLRLPGAFLSRAMFTLQNVPPQPKELAPGVSLQLQEMEEGISNFDLSLSLKEKGAGLVGVLRYKTDLFQGDTIATLGANLETLLNLLVEDPHQPLDLLPQFGEFLPEDAAAEAFGLGSSVPFVAPATAEEQAIAALWQEVLKVDRVGRDDNFFELGGRSLAMVQVYVKLQNHYGPGVSQRLAVPELFKVPTLRAMADYVAKQLQPET